MPEYDDSVEQKVWKVYDFNYDIFQDLMEELNVCITNKEIERGRDILEHAWRLVIEMRGLAVKYPEAADIFEARYQAMADEVDRVIRQLEDDAFHRWHDFHYAQYKRTGPYIYADYPSYSQPGKKPQGNRPASNNRPPNWGHY